MKSTIAVLLCTLSFLAYAQSNLSPEAEKAWQARRPCIATGQIFKSAAEARDQGYDPKTAFQIAGSLAANWKLPGIDAELVKKVVNLVYFDPAFSNAGGYRLQNQMEELCATGRDTGFKPLK